MDPLQPDDPSKVGQYRLIGRLGEGGMGRVFLGASPGGRLVAVKLIHPGHAGTQFRERFAREIEAARKVGGFHTAPVVDADPTSDPPWMVTAYVRGPSLQGAVMKLGPFDPHKLCALGAGLAEGLAAIHACGLVHRDLKPSNVILADDGPRIIDFGIARAAEADRITTLGTVVGTYSYMSPEQVRGDLVGPASDVFSLGSTLAFAATARAPFGDESIPTVVHRVISEAPDLRAVTHERGFRSLLMECLAKSPAHRPGMADILFRLTESVSGEAPGDGINPLNIWGAPESGHDKTGPAEEMYMPTLTAGTIHGDSNPPGPALGHVLPSQNTFAVNAASRVDTPHNASAPVHPGNHRASELLNEALHAARAITEAAPKAEAFVHVAAALAPFEPARADRIVADAERLTRSAFDDGPKAVVLAHIAAMLAHSDPRRARLYADSAERRARQADLQWERMTALGGVAAGFMPFDPHRAERIIVDVLGQKRRRDKNRRDDPLAIFLVVEALAPSDPERAERITGMIADDGLEAAALANISAALTYSDPDRAERLIADAEHMIYGITHQNPKAAALARIAKALAYSDSDRAQHFIAEAKRLIDTLPKDHSWENTTAWVRAIIAEAMASVATAMARSDPDRAEVMAQEITDNRWRAAALAGVAEALTG